MIHKLLSLLIIFTLQSILTPPVESQFANPINISAEAGLPFSIRCNSSYSSALTWIQTVNQTGVFYSGDTRVLVQDNGRLLNFTVVRLADDEKFACGYVNTTTGSFRVISAFYLYVKVVPRLTFLVNNKLIRVNETVELINNASNITYAIVCSAVDSKPNLNLTFDSSFDIIPFTSSNTRYFSRCNATNDLCTSILEANVTVSSGIYNTLNSITCLGVSTNPLYPVSVNTTRNVTVINNRTITLFELTANALFTIADVGRNPIALTCNAAANESLIWVETLDRQNLFFVTLNNRTYANGTNLTFQTIILGDEGYYGCGVTNSAGVFRMIQTFFLYVRVRPALNMFLNNRAVNATDSLTLVNNYTNITYRISCVSANSKPDVNLTIYDTATNTSIANRNNFFIYKNCSTPQKLCTNILDVGFQFGDPRFNNIASLTCGAISTDSLVSLSLQISRSVIVINQLTTVAATTVQSATAARTTASQTTLQSSIISSVQSTVTTGSQTSVPQSTTNTLPSQSSAGITSGSSTLIVTSSLSSVVTQSSTVAASRTSAVSSISSLSTAISQPTTIPISSSSATRLTTLVTSAPISGTSIPGTTPGSITSIITTSRISSTLSSVSQTTNLQTSFASTRISTTAPISSTSSITQSSKQVTSAPISATTLVQTTRISATTGISGTTQGQTTAGISVSSTRPLTSVVTSTISSLPATSGTSVRVSTSAAITTAAVTSQRVSQTTRISDTSGTTARVSLTTGITGTTASATTPVVSSGTTVRPLTTTAISVTSRISTTAAVTTAGPSATSRAATTAAITSATTVRLSSTAAITSATTARLSSTAAITSATTARLSSTAAIVTTASTAGQTSTTRAATTAAITSATTARLSSTAAIASATTARLSSTAAIVSTATTARSTTTISTASTARPATQITSVTTGSITSATASTTTTTSTTSTTTTSTASTSTTTTTTTAPTPQNYTTSFFNSVSVFTGTNYTIVCPFIFPLNWTYSVDNITFILINSSSKYFSGIRGNVLNLVNVAIADTLYYSCYTTNTFNPQQILFSTTYLYAKTLPVLRMSVNSRTQLTSNPISFGTSTQLTLVCTAINSRPNVALNLFNVRNNVTLTLAPSRNNIANPFSSCDSNNLCLSSLTVTLTPGYAFWNNVTQVACSAENNTGLFSMYTSATFSLSSIPDACLNNQCQSGSTCIPLRSVAVGYICRCPTGFGGPLCNYTDMCAANTNYCNGNGLCQIDGSGRMVCTCLSAYTGTTCKFLRSQCSSICQNGGVCVATIATEQGYFCQCPPTFRGTNCTEPFNPCTNGGVPIFSSTSGTGYTCNCSASWVGNVCQYANPCVTRGCRNNGICTVLDEPTGSFLCECGAGYRGDQCEIDINNTCVDSNPDLCVSLSNVCSGFFGNRAVSSICRKTCNQC